MSTPSDDPHPLERRLQALSPTRRAIVERLLREREGRRADMLAPTPIRFEGAVVPRPVRDGLLAVSFGQHRLWFMAQLDSASSVYNTVSSVTLATPVSIKTFARGSRRIGGTARELADNVRSGRWRTVPTHPSARPGDRSVGPPTPEFVRRPFDLEHGPLVRICVNVDTGQVVACVHHIVTDGWSMGIFLRELSLLYTAGCAGKLAPLTPLPIQYADFAVWQRAELAGPRLAELLNFWRTELANCPCSTLSRIDRVRRCPPSKGGLFRSKSRRR